MQQEDLILVDLGGLSETRLVRFLDYIKLEVRGMSSENALVGLNTIQRLSSLETRRPEGTHILYTSNQIFGKVNEVLGLRDLVE
jgi:hypothetical protein